MAISTPAWRCFHTIAPVLPYSQTDDTILASDGHVTSSCHARLYIVRSSQTLWPRHLPDLVGGVENVYLDLSVTLSQSMTQIPPL